MLFRVEEGCGIVWYVVELLNVCVKVIPQSSEIDGVFLNDTESLGHSLLSRSNLPSVLRCPGSLPRIVLQNSHALLSHLFPFLSTHDYLLLPMSASSKHTGET